MIVCICNAVRESQVRECARQGCRTPCQAFQTLGRQPKCGQCAATARAIMADERAAA